MRGFFDALEGCPHLPFLGHLELFAAHDVAARQQLADVDVEQARGLLVIELLDRRFVGGPAGDFAADPLEDVEESPALIRPDGGVCDQQVQQLRAGAQAFPVGQHQLYHGRVAGRGQDVERSRRSRLSARLSSRAATPA